MSELEYDTERAHQRQYIMNKRLEDEYQKQILETKNNIATITENIIATRKELDMTIQKIKELEDEIVKQSANTIEIEKIDSDIEKYNAMIQQTENNIKQLCGL
jgi:transketolase